MSKINSISISHNKNTMNSATVKMPVPEKIFIPLSMSANVPTKPVVKPGEYVLRGQKIGEAEQPFAVPVHSSVSGTVISVEDFLMPNNIATKIVEIKSDSVQNECFAAPEINNREEFLEAVKQSGMVGLGGAAFPTHIKLAPKNPDALKTLIVNVAECEPYITSDYRTVMEDYESVCVALKYIKRFIGIEEVIFAVEENKPEAIRLIKESGRYPVKTLKSQYPQGAEKVIIFETVGKILYEGKLPAEIGVLVLNVTTLAKMGRFFTTGEPLLSKRVTVDGSAVKNPGNIEVPIGTPISELFDFCGLSSQPKKILLGGPMMGIALADMGFPVIKSTNAVLAFDENDARSPQITPCIRCGRCYRACPFHLMPAEFERRYYSGDAQALEKLNIKSCIECGVCSYVCPAKRDLVATNRLAKNLVKSCQRKKNER